MILKNNWTDLESLPKDLTIAKETLYDCCNLDVTQPEPEEESSEYDAYRFRLHQKNICYRKAKITPTKTGQFVTLWKRNTAGIIEPFDFTDAIDFVIVSVRMHEQFGQFVFPKAVLLEKGIFTNPKKEGKRATRVYPPWDETTNKQAQKTQQWQLNYFYSITPETNLKLFKTLF